MANHPSDFNIESIMDRAPSPEVRSTDDEVAAERVRRACAELEGVCANLSGAEQAALRARIDSILTQLTSGVSPNVLLAVAVPTAQREASGYQAIEAQRTQEAIFNGIALSAEAQARVNYRVNALESGNYADYYFSTLDPENRFDSQTRQYILQELQRDPELKANADAVVQLGPDRIRHIEERHEKHKAFLDERIAAAETDEERAEWLNVRKYQLMRIPGMAEKLSHATPEQLHGLVEEGITNRVNLARTEVDQFGPQTPLGSVLRKHFSKDHYSIDTEDLRELLIKGNSAEAEQAVKALAAAHGDYSKLPEEQQALAAAGMIAQHLNANFLMQSNILTALKSMHSERGNSEVGHEDHFSQILDKTVPQKDRVLLLAQELREHGDANLKALSDEDLKRQAREFLKTVDLLDNPSEAVLGDARTFELQFDAARTRNSLSRNYADAEKVAALQSLAGSDASLQYMLTGAAKILNSKKYDDTLKQQTRDRLDIAASVATNADFKEPLSIFKYYNLGNAPGGQELFARIISGEVDAAKASQEVHVLQKDALTRMEPYNLMAGAASSNLYMARVKAIPGMLHEDGSLNIENLIELARHNRDALDARGETVAQRANEPWDSLSDEKKDARSVARVAAMFKAVDLVRNFGAAINDTIAYSKDMGQQLSADLAIYEQMTNTYGIVSEAEQRAAIDSFLKRDSYYASSAELRAELTDFVVSVTKDPRTHEMLTNTEFLKNRDGQLKPGDYGYIDAEPAAAAQPPVVLPQPQTTNGGATIPAEAGYEQTTTSKPSPQLTSAEKKQLAAEGAADSRDALFQNQLEDRIQDVLNKMDMKQIVEKFGQYLGQYNIGQQDNITHHEIENALQAAGVTDVKQLTDGKSTRIDAAQLENALKTANFNRPSEALAVQGADAAAAGGFPPPSANVATQAPETLGR